MAVHRHTHTMAQLQCPTKFMPTRTHGCHTQQCEAPRSANMLLAATGPHLWRSCLVVIEVEVDDIPHLLPAPVHHPIMAVKGQRAAKPAAQARQRAAG